MVLTRRYLVDWAGFVIQVWVCVFYWFRAKRGVRLGNFLRGGVFLDYCRFVVWEGGVVLIGWLEKGEG